MRKTHPWYVISYPMGDEDAVLYHCLEELNNVSEKGIAVLPEYVAYTPKQAEKALMKLKETATKRKISIITTLNIVPVHLPHMKNNSNYNTLVVITKEGKVHTPQAKITPQSFERRQYDEKFPKINVSDYYYLNKVQMKIGNEVKTALFVICSDIYTLLAGVKDVQDFKVDYCIVPGNFGNGAEAAVRRVLQRFRSAGIFETTIFSNPYQLLKKAEQTPLVQKACDYEQKEQDVSSSLTDWERIQLLKQNFLIYPDEQIQSFVHMANYTTMDEGRITVPMSRFHINVKVEQYPEMIEL
ncbi:hypothetical protein [Bacillus alveayuensis]|jgi:hypothetical protein|uniref:hypothetical protein n=1 Tax=Aeribacillus alveayuensis TaxID=279215 RepID=UPI0005CD4049|nr:hypothetical protein [Bacillus alveayuensis]